MQTTETVHTTQTTGGGGGGGGLHGVYFTWEMWHLNLGAKSTMQILVVPANFPQINEPKFWSSCFWHLVRFVSYTMCGTIVLLLCL